MPTFTLRLVPGGVRVCASSLSRFYKKRRGYFSQIAVISPDECFVSEAVPLPAILSSRCALTFPVPAAACGAPFFCLVRVFDASDRTLWMRVTRMKKFRMVSADGRKLELMVNLREKDFKAGLTKSRAARMIRDSYSQASQIVNEFCGKAIKIGGATIRGPLLAPCGSRKGRAVFRRAKRPSLRNIDEADHALVPVSKWLKMKRKRDELAERWRSRTAPDIEGKTIKYGGYTVKFKFTPRGYARSSSVRSKIIEFDPLFYKALYRANPLYVRAVLQHEICEHETAKKVFYKKFGPNAQSAIEILEKGPAREAMKLYNKIFRMTRGAHKKALAAEKEFLIKHGLDTKRYIACYHNILIRLGQACNLYPHMRKRPRRLRRKKSSGPL